MQAVIDVILPVFGLIVLGYFAARAGWVRDASADGLTRIVFDVAMPIMLFSTMNQVVMPGVSPWGLWAAYFGGCAASWLMTTAAARHVLGRPHDKAAISGLSSAYSNTILLGLPLILKAYGDAGAVPLFIVVSVHLPLMSFIGALHVEAARGESTSMKMLLRETFKGLMRQPILIGILAGLAFRQTGLELPGAVDRIVESISAGAIPFALFAMGLTLKRYGLFGDLPAASLIVTVKLIVHPLIVWALAALVLELPPVWIGVATVFAAAPTGINPYLWASRYGVGVGAVSSAIAMSTMLSAITITVVLVALGLDPQ